MSNSVITNNRSEFLLRIISFYDKAIVVIDHLLSLDISSEELYALHNNIEPFIALVNDSNSFLVDIYCSAPEDKDNFKVLNLKAYRVISKMESALIDIINLVRREELLKVA